jgi:hypothetical protein
MLVSRNPALFFGFSLGDGLRPLTSWRFAIPIFQTSFELRSQGSTLHGPKGGSTAIPSWITPAVPATFSLFNQTTAAKKLRRKLIQLLTSSVTVFGLIRKC